MLEIVIIHKEITEMFLNYLLNERQHPNSRVVWKKYSKIDERYAKAFAEKNFTRLRNIKPDNARAHIINYYQQFIFEDLRKTYRI